MKKRVLMCMALALMYLDISAATHLLLLRSESDTLNKYLGTIVPVAFDMAREREVVLHQKYKIPFAKAEKIFSYLKQCELRKACYNYIYRDSIVRRVRCKLEIDSIYRDSINALLIPVEGNDISGENISLVLNYARVIDLDEAQYQYIMDKALEFARRIYTNPRINVWNDEINFIRNTLTSKQLTDFFFNKNAGIVTNEIDNGWQKLKNAGLTERLDSVEDIRLAYIYYQRRQEIKDVFRYYGTSQKKYLLELNKDMPPMVKMLDNLERQGKAEERKKENKEKIGKEFVW